MYISKACGPDFIPPRLLKEGAEDICTSLAHLFQMSLDSGTLPFDWTSANAISVLSIMTDTSHQIIGQ